MGPTTLSINHTTINQYNYVEILEDYLLPNAQAYYGDDWRFQQDNAAPHTAKSTREWLGANVPSVLEWPPNSPDFSPIENMWPILKNGVEKENAKILTDIEQKIVEIWNGIDLSIPRRVLETVPALLKCCRDLKGE